MTVFSLELSGRTTGDDITDATRLLDDVEAFAVERGLEVQLAAVGELSPSSANEGVDRG